MNIVEYADRDLLMMGLADVLSSEINSALMREDKILFVVPGGSTPGPIFDMLSGVNLDWERVAVLLSDERWVPESSARSNTRLVKERLLVGRAAKAEFLPLYAEGSDPEDQVEDLAIAIRPLLPVSVLLLGMGADMHTASLFPGAPELAAALSPDAPIVMAIHAPEADEPRVTLSAPVLDGALAKHLVITGDEKRAALDLACKIGDPMEAPICAVLDGATVHWAA